ncbi:hypothetical protein G7Y89_g11850 [Cudoniella acicularis]|uniref:Uncharacterized protein n=1 Tax=Cudoniella acicularis TaxID=354080 RepID=A0A8H4W090_9HELO|nr:hypothetical protein G7Y89_g11850 [Cudoniella acicularis]
MKKSEMATSPIDISQLEKLRPLGKLEQFSSARHDLGLFNSVGMTCTYTLSSPSQSPSTLNSPLTTLTLKQTIYRALSSLINKHPIFSCIPVNSQTNTPYFARLPSISLSSVLSFRTRGSPFIATSEGERDTELDDLLAEQHGMNFKEDFGRVPFWRMVILTGCDGGKGRIGGEMGIESFTASLFIHHSLADGLSAVNFHRDFHFFLNEPSLDYVVKEGEDGDVVTCPRLEILPCLDDLHPLPFSSSPSPPKETRMEEIKGNRKLWTGIENPSLPSTPAKTNFLTLVLSAKTTKALIRQCKEEKSTLATVLPFIISAALSKTLSSQDPNPGCEYEFAYTIPVSLRRFLKREGERERRIGEGEMGVWIDALSYTYCPSSSSTSTAKSEEKNSFPWTEAQQLKAKISSYLHSLESLQAGEKGVNVNMPIGKFKNVPSMREMLLSRVGKPLGSSFDVSNVGVLTPLPIPHSLIRMKENGT